jgi:hypothetical protein
MGDIQSLQSMFIVTLAFPLLMLLPTYAIFLAYTSPTVGVVTARPHLLVASYVPPVTLPNPSLWVSAKPEGRLGNQLFIAASSHGIAHHRGARWCMESLGSLENAVQWLERPEPCPEDYLQFTQLNELGEYAAFVPFMFTSENQSNVSVGTYLQSYKYFSESGVPFQLNAKQWGNNWTSQRGINVGIHVRRGDYLTDKNHEGLTPPVEYYKAAILLLQSFVNDSEPLTFFVSSDDIPWIRSQDIFNGMTLTEEGRTPEQDMSILAACKHMILSAGTFSWWAAYLSPHKGDDTYKIYYSESLHDKTSIFDDLEDHYPGEWIGIDSSKVQSIILNGL